jgi:hypothetical protein
MDLASNHIRDRRSGAAIRNVCHIGVRDAVDAHDTRGSTFSTITCSPSISLNCNVVIRAITSKEPPAANGTAKEIGRVG